ncbi:MAG TPA: glucosyltransferase domain-containing protein [Candidatus Omnitrophota bacterium]|nr:glucosyltransferase domain-containing protein [Candidatus Omnitrophota bacterium]
MIQKSYVHFILLSLLVLLGVLIYSNSLHGPFQFDDKDYIIENASIRKAFDPKAILNSRWGGSRLIAFMTFGLNYHFHRLDTFGYHLVNLLIHLINTFLVWWFVRLTLETQPPLQKHHDLFSYLIALLFLTHPIQTQAVTYISQRFTSLAMMFYVLSMCLYIAARRGGVSPPFVGRGYRAPTYALSALCAVAAMLTKQTALTLPLNIILYEYLFLASPKEKGRAKALHTAIILSFLLIIPALYRFDILAVLNAQAQSASHYGDHLTSFTYFLTQPRVIIKYLQLLFVPLGQNLIHDVPTSQHFFEAQTLLSFAFLLMVIVLAVKLCRRHVFFSYAIFWFFLCLSAESSFITITHVMFEHRLYLPSVGFFMALTYGGWMLFKDNRKVIIFFIIYAVILSFLTYQRNKVWRTDISLWQDVTQKSPDLLIPHVKLGVALLNKRRPIAALKAFNEALRVDPTHPNVYYNRAITYNALGRRQEAANDMLKAVEFGLKVPPGYLEELKRSLSLQQQ